MKLLLLKSLSACALLLCSFAWTASAQEKIDLQKAVDLALQRNLTIKQSGFTEALDNANLQQSKNNRLPSLSASASVSENFGRVADASTYQYTVNQSILQFGPSVGAQVTLFQGGQLRNQIIQNKLLVEADRSNTAKIRNDLVLSVIVDYLQILTNQDLVTAAKQQIDIANQTLDRANINFKVGNQTLADLSQAKAGVSTAQLNLTNAQNQLDLSTLILKQYMEMNPATPIEVVKPDISKITDVKTAFDPENIVATALKVNPDVKLAESQQAVYGQAIKVAKGTYYPTLYLSGNLFSNYSSAQPLKQIGSVQSTQTTGYLNGDPSQPVTIPYRAPLFGAYPFFDKLNDRFGQSIGLSLQIPIFNRYNARTNVKRAQINFESASVSTQIAKNNLTKTIYQAVLDARASANQYQSAQQTYQANKDAFNVIQQRYNVGLVNSLDYNTSLTNLNTSENNMIQARYQMIFRSKVIDYYLGNPITL